MSRYDDDDDDGYEYDDDDEWDDDEYEDNDESDDGDDDADVADTEYEQYEGAYLPEADTGDDAPEWWQEDMPDDWFDMYDDTYEVDEWEFAIDY